MPIFNQFFLNDWSNEFFFMLLTNQGHKSNIFLWDILCEKSNSFIIFHFLLSIPVSDHILTNFETFLKQEKSAEYSVFFPDKNNSGK
jgi:hypothetical protein